VPSRFAGHGAGVGEDVCDTGADVFDSVADVVDSVADGFDTVADVLDRVADVVDSVVDVEQSDAEHTMKELARREGIFGGVSSGGSIYAALQLSKEVSNATIVAIV
jgi:threonine dehydratase